MYPLRRYADPLPLRCRARDTVLTQGDVISTFFAPESLPPSAHPPSCYRFTHTIDLFHHGSFTATNFCINATTVYLLRRALSFILAGG